MELERERLAFDSGTLGKLLNLLNKKARVTMQRAKGKVATRKLEQPAGARS